MGRSMKLIYVKTGSNKHEAVKLSAIFDGYNSLEKGSKNMIHSHKEIGIKEINLLGQ